MSNEINKLRQIVNHIDYKIIKNIASRNKIVKSLGQTKIQNNIAVIDLVRERQLKMYHHVLAKKYNVSPRFIQQIFAIIIKYSREAQNARK